MKRGTKKALWLVFAILGSLVAVGGLLWAVAKKLMPTAAGATTKATLTLPDGTAPASGGTVTVPDAALAAYKSKTATLNQFLALGLPFQAEAVMNWVRPSAYQGPLSLSNPYLGTPGTQFAIDANNALKVEWQRIHGAGSAWGDVAELRTFVADIMAKNGRPNVWPVD